MTMSDPRDGWTGHRQTHASGRITPLAIPTLAITILALTALAQIGPHCPPATAQDLPGVTAMNQDRQHRRL
jgi:hypothetical protein